MRFKVFYSKEIVRPWDADKITVETMKETHVYVIDVEAPYKGAAYWHMQGEIWSPNGEARPIIERAGTHHTSMSIGDILQDPDGKFWVCAEIGFEEMS